ncbi:MAG: hypothetical protein AAB229_00665 [Candidatus Hydrogenedentota bacterium]
MKRLLALVLAFGISTAASASLRFFETDYLPESKTHQYTVRLDGSTRYMLTSTSCSGGADYDLEVIDPDGKSVVKSTSTSEDFDFVRFDSGETGNYTLKITAYKGNNWYTLTLISPYKN